MLRFGQKMQVVYREGPEQRVFVFLKNPGPDARRARMVLSRKKKTLVLDPPYILLRKTQAVQSKQRNTVMQPSIFYKSLKIATTASKNCYIVDWAANGQKSYSYLTDDSKIVCKEKGFTLNHENSKYLNMDGMKHQ